MTDARQLMTQSSRSINVSIMLLVVGTTLNALGVTLTSAGAIRYLLMGIGLMLLLIAVLRLVSQAPDHPDRPEDPDGPRR